MTRRPNWASLAAIGAAGLIAATMATTGLAQSPSAATSAAPIVGEQPPAPTADTILYPNYGGEVDCAYGTFNGSPYAGNLKSIEATDAKTVVFTFCNPNVAFLSQIAFASLAIDDAQYLIDHASDGALLNQPNGTGPYKFSSWDVGSRIDLTANDAYWGDKALTSTMEFQWNAESAARLLALQSGTVDGIDNPGKDDMAAIDGDANLKLYPREGLNTFYIGMNNTYAPWGNPKVRQAIAQGIDRQRIVDNFYPPGSSVADYFTPCSIPFACEGGKAWDFDATAAKTLLAEGLAEEGIDPATFTTTLSYRPPPRGYLPDPPTIAQEIAGQLQTNLGINITLDQQESGTFIDNTNGGLVKGLFLLGWGADFPDASNFMDYHFGTGAGKRFGDPYPDLVAAVTKAGQTATDADRTAGYSTANDLLRELAPVAIVAHGGSATAFKADVEGAHSSPLSAEVFSVMKAGDRDILIFQQNGEPSGLYCADETDGEALRVCKQVKESLYSYEVGGTATQPSLATDCSANAELTVWTCTLRDGVTFHDGSTLDASDVVLSMAAQWDARSPLHVGRTGAFDYWPALLGGGFLNPPAAE
ncbi:MAG: ABC transporter substrate-binding protein [Chloroflexi bacterium]|nr:ABC transporter substrate-binding protein [Chloroflexota bacterium]